jgi:Concanavalin A-like lectin/glucanases superfamily
MHDAIIFAAPLLIGAIVLALRFVGCSFQPGAAVQDYSEIVLGTVGLVSFWRLNEQSGTTAADSQDSNPGTYENGVSLGGPSLVYIDTDNFAASFDGTTQFVSVPFAANINPQQFTVEAIVNPSAIGTGAQDNHAIVCSRHNDASNNRFGYIVSLSTNEFRARVADGASTVTTVTVPAEAMANGGPYYVVMSYDGTTLSLYVNAIDAFDPNNPGETAQQQASAAADYEPNTVADLLIGAANVPPPGPGLFFPGAIQDVAIYEQALDFSTIQAHFFAIMGGG